MFLSILIVVISLCISKHLLIDNHDGGDNNSLDSKANDNHDNCNTDGNHDGQANKMSKCC